MEASNLCYGCMAPRSTGNFCKLCGYNYSKGPDSERYIKPGTLINDYVFGKVLNESAYEIAYLGYHLASKKKVALKEFMPHKLAKRSGNSPQLIVEEGPNSIKFATNLQRFIQSGSNLFTFEANHTAYHVIEKVSKISLQAYLNQSGGRISYDQALVFVMQVLSQVEKYHGQGELLLDLNPAQIQVSTNGEISIQNSNEEIQHVVNGFSAKEMYFPAGNRGFFSDVYSIGAIAYYMLTGIVPEVAIERMKGRVLKPIGLLRSDINPGFGSTIMKALSVEASDRFETTEDLRQAIMNNIERSVTVVKPVPIEPSHSVNELITEKIQVIEEPVIEEPVIVESVKAEPVKAEPVIEEPVITEPVIAVTQQYYQQTYTPLENNGQPKAGVTSDTTNRQLQSPTPEKKKNKTMLLIIALFMGVVVMGGIITVMVLLVFGGGVTIPDFKDEPLAEKIDDRTEVSKDELESGEPLAEVVELTALNWSIGVDPKTIDPGLNNSRDGGSIINNTFEGLTREKSGVIYPGIAESWETSEDGLTVIFTLRDSKWSDGTDLTAHDFIYAWKRGMDPRTASEYSWIWEYTNIVGAAEATWGGSLDNVGIYAPDDNTLVIELISPTDYIVSLLSFYHFLPVKQSSIEVGANGGWSKDPAKAISNGPYKLMTYAIGEELTLEKNEHYWNSSEVNIDRINVVFMNDTSTAYKAYEKGTVDFLSNVSLTETTRFIAEDPNFYVFPLLGTYFYNFNLDLPIWDDVRVRTALSYAIDRDIIVEALASGYIPAEGLIPPGFLDEGGKDFFVRAGTYGMVADSSNVSKAQGLLEEAGFPGGEGFPKFTILYNTSESHKMVAELIREMFVTNLGIDCDIENQDWETFQILRREGDFELSRGSWITDFMDPIGLLSIFTSENTYNDSNYSNEDYDALVYKAFQTTGKDHFNLLYEANEMFMSDMPVIPVYHYTDIILVHEKVVNWDRSVLGSLDFSNASIVE